MTGRGGLNRCGLSLGRGSYLNAAYAIAENNRFTLSFHLRFDDLNQNGILLGRIPALELRDDSLSFGSWFGLSPEKYKLTKETWYHIGLSYNGSEFVCYINGSKIGSQFFSGYFEAFKYIGNNMEFFLDDLRIYNCILGQSEINELYNLPSSCAITGAEEGNTPPKYSPLSFATDVVGKKIYDLESFKGVAILHFEDGTTKKVLK